jgi:hypothetical protein
LLIEIHPNKRGDAMNSRDNKTNFIAKVEANYALASVCAIRSNRRGGLEIETADAHAVGACRLLANRAGAVSVTVEPLEVENTGWLMKIGF